MAEFSKRSKERLESCHPDIQKVMNEAIKHIDFSVLYGYRTPQEQFGLYKTGRSFIAGKWVVDGKIVTNMDGTIKKSKHNYTPSKAVDIVPYPLDWSDIEAFEKLAVVVKEAADTVGIDIQWGGDWKSFKDYPHYEIKS